MTSPRVIYFGISPQKSANEVGGWSKAEQMGLKNALTYDTTTRRYNSYTKSEITNLIDHLLIADLIVGFNQLQFDYKILSSYTDTNFDVLPNFDMLSKIEQTLNFRVSRDNLAENTLGESNHSNKRSTLEKRINTTKKLFAHGCKEGYLSYHNNRFSTQEVCDTSCWANTARSITQRQQLLDPIVGPNEPELPQSTSAPQIPSEFPKKKPLSRPTTKPPIKFPPELPCFSRTIKQVDPALGLSHKQYLRAKYLKPEHLAITQEIKENSIDNRILEEGMRIYELAKSQDRHNPELYAYDEMIKANLLDSDISPRQFRIAITKLWTSQKPRKSNYDNGNSRYFYFDGSGTLAFERVNDHVGIRNIKEELARGI